MQSEPHLVSVGARALVRVVPSGYTTRFVKNVVAHCRDFYRVSCDLHTADENENECENEGYEFSCFHDDVPPVFSSVVVCGRVTYRGYMLGTRARTTQTIGLSSDPLRDNLRLWSKIYHYQSVLIIQ